MTIEHTKGDLLEYFKNGDVECIAHCCNCQGAMGSGIAVSIKEDYPAAYEAYKAYEEYFGLELGTVSGNDNVYNLHAQNLYGKKDGSVRYVDYEALYTCLETVRIHMIQSGLIHIGFPYKMAADRAGGDWDVIEAMIVSVFKDTDIYVTIVEFDGTRNK